MTTLLDKWKELAKIENQRMLEAQWGGRSPNYGVTSSGNGSGKPRMADIKRSKPAQELLRLSEQGYSLAEAARFTATPVEDIIRRSRRFQIQFKGGYSGPVAK